MLCLQNKIFKSSSASIASSPQRRFRETNQCTTKSAGVIINTNHTNQFTRAFVSELETQQNQLNPTASDISLRNGTWLLLRENCHHAPPCRGTYDTRAWEVRASSARGTTHPWHKSSTSNRAVPIPIWTPKKGYSDCFGEQFWEVFLPAQHPLLLSQLLTQRDVTLLLPLSLFLILGCILGGNYSPTHRLLVSARKKNTKNLAEPSSI